MAKKLSLRLDPQQKTAVKQYHLMMIQPRMQQALSLLQAPLQELGALIEQEMERNPLLDQEETVSGDEDWEEVEDSDTSEREVEIDDQDFGILERLDEDCREHFTESGGYNNRRDAEEEKKRMFMENNVCNPETLHQKLTDQARETFDFPEELAAAEWIIGNFDEGGYLGSSLKEIAFQSGICSDLLNSVLEKIQSFEPYGVGAENIRDSLLIQLRCLGKEGSAAYRLIHDHYNDLLRNRLPKIARKLNCTVAELRQIIEGQIARLDLHPGLQCAAKQGKILVPDVIIREENGQLVADINNEFIPTLCLNRKYIKLMKEKESDGDIKEFLKQHLSSAKWFVRSIYQRSETLRGIAIYLLEKQRAFIEEPDGQLAPLCMREAAEALEVHESTIARAVAGKYMHTPRGIFSLRSFFTNGYVTEEGKELSSKTVKRVLNGIIDGEDKLKPFSDRAVSEALNAMGIPCARRTVAKYRRQFGIGTAAQRRQFKEEKK